MNRNVILTVDIDFWTCVRKPKLEEFFMLLKKIYCSEGNKIQMFSEHHDMVSTINEIKKPDDYVLINIDAHDDLNNKYFMYDTTLHCSTWPFHINNLKEYIWIRPQKGEALRDPRKKLPFELKERTISYFLKNCNNFKILWCGACLSEDYITDDLDLCDSLSFIYQNLEAYNSIFNTSTYELKLKISNDILYQIGKNYFYSKYMSEN